MENKVDTKKIHEWLIKDQYSYGEWGKHEISNPTEEPRTLEHSKLKPHFFSSMYAFYSLISTNAEKGSWFDNYMKWINSIRNEQGYWTSASGSEVPFGSSRGWSNVINIRHTAKGLDLLLLTEEFVGEDTPILMHVLKSQKENGAFTQLIDGSVDIWSTAYAMNLLIRLLDEKYLKITKPRALSIDLWKSEISTALKRAHAWIVSQVDMNGLWNINDRDPMWISEAVIIELGAYLSLTEPELCSRTIERLLEEKTQRQSTILYGAILVFNTLSIAKQVEVIRRVEALLSEPKDSFQDMMEATSLCKISYLKNNVGILDFYKKISGGHESCLIELAHWKESDYFNWSVKNFRNESISLKSSTPISLTITWQIVKELISEYKRIIEYNRGWKLLWKEKGKHQNEDFVQIDFYRIANTLCNQYDISTIREPETGRGPADFTFINGIKQTILVEFKLANNSALSGKFLYQLSEYMRGLGINSAFIVIIGFGESEDMMETINDKISNFLNQNNNLFVEAIFIDANYRVGASIID